MQCQGDVETGTAPFFNTPLFPLNSLYNYSRTMSLILRSELDPGVCTPQVITHLAIYVDLVGEPFTFANVQLRLKKSTATEVTSAWDGTGTLAWSGSLAFSATGWHVFDIPDFNWDADNLLITWQYGPTPWVLNGPRFRAKYIAPGVYRQSYAYGDDSLPTTMTPTLSRVYYAIVFQGPSGACCNAISGACSVVSAADCLAAGGEFQGPDTSCIPNPCQPCVLCPPDGIPAGEADCYDNYVDTTNSGCSDPNNPTFTSINLGDTICGTAGNFLNGTSSMRDTDWYRVVTTEPMTFTWTVSPTFPAAIGLIEQTNPGVPGCANITGYLNPYATPATCQTGSVTTACLPAGSYYFFVAPAGYIGTPCGSLYVATLTGTPCMLGACCVSTPTPSCSVTTDTACATAGGTFLGAGTACSGLDCNGNGVDDRCDIASGFSQDLNANGIPDECETGACCYPGYTCQTTTQANCTGQWLGAGTTCIQCPPPPSGACCQPDGSCAMTTQAGCVGTWQGPGTNCSPNPCPQPEGACCYPDYGCQVTAQAECTGQWLGAGTACSECPSAPAAACCTAYVCTLATEAVCTAGGGTWKGLGTTCSSGICVCTGDTNCDGSINYADINAFVKALDNLYAWEAQFPHCPWQNCDINADGYLSYADINPFVAKLGSPGPCP